MLLCCLCLVVLVLLLFLLSRCSGCCCWSSLVVVDVVDFVCCRFLLVDEDVEVEEDGEDEEFDVVDEIL